MPAWGSVEPLLGTNPIAVAVPALEEPPVVMDMSPTVAAYGKVRLKAARGEEMPVGWMIDRDGKPLTDPSASRTRTFMLPIGDYKGYALSLIIGLLAGSLNGAAFGREIAELTEDADPPANVGQSVVALSVEAFAPVADFKRNVDVVIRKIRGAARLPGVERIWLPGEQSHETRLDRAARGIPLPEPLRGSLDALARELGIEPVV